MERRNFLKTALTFGSVTFASAKALLAQQTGRDMAEMPDMDMNADKTQHKARSSSPLPVESPDVPQLRHRLDEGVKEFHLIAEAVKQELVPGKLANLWGFNGSAPGPTIQVNQGDRVRI